MLVLYLLSGIRILVYSCTGCSTSKIYLCIEDNRASFSWVSLKSEFKDALVHKQSFSVKDMILRNKNLTSNNLKMNNFMFNFKQLKMNKFIKYIWLLIISTLNATLQVPSLHPCNAPNTCS